MQTTAPTFTTSVPVENRRGCLFYLKRGLLGLLIIIIALPVTGILYEAVMAAGDANRYPPPGQLVSVGDHNLHIYCISEGSPTVVLEVGANSNSLDWIYIQPEVANFTRVCVYDRAGFGWSEPSSAPRTPAQIATELHTALVNAGEEAPYVLLGHSVGGKYIRLFAASYPDEVAGMVFEDARHENLEPERTLEENERDREAYASSLGLYSFLRTIGVARALGSVLQPMVNPPTEFLSPELRTQMTVFGTRETTLNTMISEGAGGTANDEQLAAASMGNIPVFVLTAGTSVEAEPRWLGAQEALAALSTDSRLEIVEGASHNIHWDHPTRVVEAIRAVVDSVRTGQPLA